jgi:hypothetical protein
MTLISTWLIPVGDHRRKTTSVSASEAASH